MSTSLLALALGASPLVNGFFDAGADNTTLTAAGYLGTTWRANDLGTGGAAVVSRQAFTFTQVEVPEDPEFFLRWAQSTGGTVTNPELLNLVEEVRTLAGEMATLHGFYRSNVAVDVRLRQDFGTGGSPSADVNTPIETLALTVDTGAAAPSWKPFSITFRVPRMTGRVLGSTANTSYLGVRFLFPLAVAFQFDLANVRLTRGGSRDVSPRRVKAIESDMVRRYYQTFSIFAPVSTQSPNGYLFPSEMRAAPSLSGAGGTHSVPTVASAAIISTGVAASVPVIADARIAP